MPSPIDCLTVRCEQALPRKYGPRKRPWAETSLRNELAAIKQRNLQDVFLEADQAVEACRRRGTVCRLIGSGCTSQVAFLLGLSDIDPIRFRLPWQRFHAAGGTQPPNLHIATSQTQTELADLPRAGEFIAWKPMSPLEKLAWSMDGVHDNYLPHDPAVYSLFAAKTTEAIFQFEHDHPRQLAAIVQPQQLVEIAIVTALVQIQLSHPEVLAKFQRAQGGCDTSGATTTAERPILFQEQIMNCLKKWARVPGEVAYAFIKAAAGNQAQQAGLDSVVLEALLRRTKSVTEAERRFQPLKTAARYSVCLSHHLANAVTSYRAAYLVTHHSSDFQKALAKLPAEL